MLFGGKFFGLGKQITWENNEQNNFHI